jgi:hypothetical protein
MFFSHAVLNLIRNIPSQSLKTGQIAAINIFVPQKFVKKMLHLGANRIKRSVCHELDAVEWSFPQSFQQNC